MGEEGGKGNSFLISGIGGKFIAAFFSFSTYLTTSHVDSASALFGIVLKIPIHNTSIYFTKLYSLRCLLIGIGTFVEYILYLCFSRVGKRRLNRLYISALTLSLMLVTRIVVLIALYCSSHLSYHIYIILAAEAFILGSTFSITAIVPNHSVAVILGYNACRLFIPSIQFVLDLLMSNPFTTIKIQSWVSAILTLVALSLWIWFIVSTQRSPESNQLDRVSDEEMQTEYLQNTLKRSLSAFLMFPMGCVLKDFIYPGILPYALLQRDKCHIINKIATILYVIGPVTLLILENLNAFDKWTVVYNIFWLLLIPTLIVLILSLLAIHTRIPSATTIINSKWRVGLMTLSIVVYYAYMYPVGLTGLSKIVHNGFNGKKGNNAVITFNVTLATLCRFIFSKISVGYNDTRVRLGYHLPKFRPNHRMSDSNTFWYIFKNTFKKAASDTVRDFRMNIKDYL